MRKIKVAELFAGVGGFRLGLEGDINKRSATSGYKEKLQMPRNYEVVWSNQFEPATKIQHASLVYSACWSSNGHSSEDIFKVVSENIDSVVNHHMLVGGFPCQDYSVMTSLRRSNGLMGKKGVLWWSIEALLKKKGKYSPKFLILENVDRLLTSPANQKGRDFAMILASLDKLGYAVEWRVINAAEYGMPQRRRRVFVVAYRVGSSLYDILSRKHNSAKYDKYSWITEQGVFGTAFPVEKTHDPVIPMPKEKHHKLDIEGDFDEISERFNRTNLKSSKPAFGNAGYMIQGKYYSTKTTPIFEKKFPLSKLLQTEKQVQKEFRDFYIDEDEILKVPIEYRTEKGEKILINTIGEKWRFLKGSKRIPKINKNGYEYLYAEGKMQFPDPLDEPSRTIITAEGGNSPSRTKHVVQVNGVLRRLTPVELERANMFPDNHTRLEGILNSKRAFFMGNALVVGVVERIGRSLAKRIKESDLEYLD